MPTIISQPSTSVLHAAYGSGLNYTLTQAFTASDPYPAIEARIIINSALFSTQYYTPSDVITTTAYFNININGIVQEWFDSLNSSPGSFEGYVNSVLTESLASVRVDFYTWSAVDGLLEQVGSPANSATSRAINSAQTKSIVNFYTSPNRQFLTNKPDRHVMKLNEGETIAIYTTVNSEMIVKCYNENGLQAERRKTLSGSSNRIVALGIGVENLIALTDSPGWDSEPYVVGGDIFDGGSSKYYTVEIGQVSGAVFSELRTYYIDESSDCLAYRIYFLNKLGFYDAVSIYQSTLNTFETQSLSFQRLATETNAATGARLYSKLTNGFSAHFLGMTDEMSTWLKELANTVDAYETDLTRHVIVKDLTGTEKDTYAAMNEMLLQFLFTELEYSQRN